jgi:hypothetical protein
MAQKKYFFIKFSTRQPEISIGKYNQFIARISQFFGHSQINTPNWLIYAINWLNLPIFILSVLLFLWKKKKAAGMYCSHRRVKFSSFLKVCTKLFIVEELRLWKLGFLIHDR